MKRSISATWPIPAVSLFAVLAALVAGCSSGPSVLAKVGDKVITNQDFIDVARRNQNQYLGRPDSAKAALLDDMVKRDLLVLAAEKRGLVSAEDRQRLLQQAEQQLALRTLVQRLAPADVPVSDAEVQALYRQRANEAHLQVVFTPDSMALAQALAEIRAGADFGAVADRHNTTGMTPPKGDLGFRLPGSLIPALDRYVAEAPLGQIQGPIESMGDGWFLLKVLERRPYKQPPFEQERDALKQMISSTKRRALLDKAQRDLLAQYHVRLEPGGAQVLFARYNAPRDTARVGQTAVPVPGAPTAQENAQVLVRYDDANGKAVSYTVANALQDLRSGTGPRPNFAMVPMIEQWLRSMALQKVLELEVQRRHLDREPSVVHDATERVNNELLQVAYNLLVAGATAFTDSDLRAAYERHLSQLVRLQTAQLRLATFADSAAAARAATAVAGGTPLAEAVRAAGAGAHVSETTLRFPTQDPLWARMEGPLLGMKPGQASGALPAARGWMVFQLVDKTQAQQEYDKLDPQVRQVLQTEAREINRDRRLTALTDSLRREYRPVVYERRLAKIPWPVPPATPGT